MSTVHPVMQAIADRFILKAESLNYELHVWKHTSYSSATHETHHKKNKSILFRFHANMDPLAHHADCIHQQITTSITGVRAHYAALTIDEFERIIPNDLEALHQQLTASRSTARAAKMAMQQTIKDEGKKIKLLVDKLKM